VLLKPKAIFNKTFHDIKEAGGLHEFLGFDGTIVLSNIMRDELLAKMNPQTYAKVINTLLPDYFTTIDGETYEGENDTSWREIERMLKESRTLMRKCPEAIPIGLVKGCTEEQIEFHAETFRNMGTDSLMFHTGDFFRNGSDIEMINRARFYASRIKPYTDNLILYGIGSPRRILEFSFADVYVTFNHFITAKMGMRYEGRKMVRHQGYNQLLVHQNLHELIRNMQVIEQQKRLTNYGDVLWEEEGEAAEPAMLRQPLRVGR